MFKRVMTYENFYTFLKYYIGTHNSIENLNIVKTNDITQIILLPLSLIIGYFNI